MSTPMMTRSSFKRRNVGRRPRGKRPGFLKSMSLLALQDSKSRPARFNGIQMGAHTMLDEGIERCLDLVQETAGINALLVYSHAYNGELRKPLQYLAADHGITPRD